MCLRNTYNLLSALGSIFLLLLSDCTLLHSVWICISVCCITYLKNSFLQRNPLAAGSEGSTWPVVTGSSGCAGTTSYPGQAPNATTHLLHPRTRCPAAAHKWQGPGLRFSLKPTLTTSENAARRLPEQLPRSRPQALTACASAFPPRPASPQPRGLLVFRSESPATAPPAVPLRDLFTSKSRN